MIETDNHYWRDIAYKTNRFGVIYKPDGEGKLNTFPRSEIRSFMQFIFKQTEEVGGDVLDLCAGTNTGYYFSETITQNRKLIAVDIALAAHEIITRKADKSASPKNSKIPDKFIVADLNVQRLTELNFLPNDIVLASLIDGLRYLKDDSLGNIAEDLQHVLAPGGIFVIVDFEKLNKSEAQEMGEMKQLTGEVNDQIMDLLEKLGYCNVEFFLIREEFGDNYSRFAITAKKPRN